MATGFAYLFSHHYRVFHRHYIRNWSYAYISLGVAAAVRLLYLSVESTNWSGPLFLQLLSFIVLTAVLFYPCWLLQGMFQAFTNKRFSWRYHHIFSMVTTVAATCIFIPLSFTDFDVLLQDDLRALVAACTVAFIFLLASYQSFKVKRKHIGTRLLAWGLLLWAFVMASVTLIPGLLDESWRHSEWYIYFPTAELFFSGMLAVGLMAWLQEDTRLTSQKVAQKAEYLDSHDLLTGAGNRESLIQMLTSELEHRSRKRYLTVVVLGLDGFKLINDNFGLKHGDKVLSEVVRRIESSELNTMHIARIGGDLFALVLGDIYTDQQWRQRAEFMLHLLEKPFILSDHSVKLTASIGLSIFPTHSDNAEAMLQKANIAFHNAKRRHNTYVIYERGMEEESNRLLEVGKALRQAIEQDEFEFWYQPQLNLTNGRLEGLEALVRWHHPERGILSPGAFFDDVEKLELSKVLDDLLLEKAIKKIALWQQSFQLNIPVAVNLSPIQFQSDDLVPRIRKLLVHYQASPWLLELEITENVAMEDIEAGLNTIRVLQQMGVKVSIDDFGTGYSSLAYLRKMPIEKIKIDRSFICEMQLNDSDFMIVKSMVQLAHGLGKRVLAEGVETSQQQRLLQDIHCDAIQGFHFHRPLNEDAVIRLLKEQDVAVSKQA